VVGGGVVGGGGGEKEREIVTGGAEGFIEGLTRGNEDEGANAEVWKREMLRKLVAIGEFVNANGNGIGEAITEFLRRPDDDEDYVVKDVEGVLKIVASVLRGEEEEEEEGEGAGMIEEGEGEGEREGENNARHRKGVAFGTRAITQVLKTVGFVERARERRRIFGGRARARAREGEGGDMNDYDDEYDSQEWLGELRRSLNLATVRGLCWEDEMAAL